MPETIQPMPFMSRSVRSSRVTRGYGKTLPFLAAAVMGVVAAAAPAGAEVGPLGEAVWIEGEDYTSSSFNNHSWYVDDNLDLTQLSPAPSGGWHVHYSGFAFSSAVATYTVHIEQGGEYDWWIRLNPFRNGNGGGNYDYRLDGGSWTSIDVSESDQRGLLDGGRGDIRFIGWSFGDRLELTPGTHTVQIRVSSRRDQFGRVTDSEVHGGIDAMAFTNWGWGPAGVFQPDPSPETPLADEWFPLSIGPDAFSPESIIDMSGLLEETAGSHGPLARSGDDLVFQDGTPVKFWAVDAHYASATPAAMERQARFYAKHGINMVRQHTIQGAVGQIQGPAGGRYLDPERLDAFDRWFATLKDQGIYMTWSIFYHHQLRGDERQSQGGQVPDDLYSELPSNKDTYGYASFVDEYQDSQWAYAELLLNHVNPYTGLAYKDDPALAIVEMRNEDSVFFHNPLGHDFVHGTAAPAHRLYLRRLWHQWVADRYANDSELSAAWGWGMQPNDSVNADPVTQPMEMYAAWQMDAAGEGSQTARMGDFIRFLADMQREDYDTYRSRLRSLGYDGVVVSTAWKAGGPAATAANLWTDDVMDAIDRHNYFGGGVGGHNIAEGAVNNETHLSTPGRGILSSGFFQVEDKPFMMTEWTQKPPNQWKAEISPLMAFYGMGLQGWDSLYQFAGSRSYMGNGWPAM